MNVQCSPTDPAARRFIEKSMVARIAACSPRGNPDIIPLFFVLHRGKVYMGTRSENPLVRDLRANPAVVLLFHGERLRRSDRVLRVRGRARWVSWAKEFRWLYLKAGLRYYLASGGFWNNVRHWRLWRTRRRYGRERAGPAGMIEVTPESAEFVPA